jgi:hypothetical protein
MKNDIKPPVITIMARVRMESMLRDTRYFSYEHIFGKVEDVAKQYGVKATQKEGYMEFSAPKSRMQLFVEKLHFAGVAFREK